jgi:hypothetical protein
LCCTGKQQVLGCAQNDNQKSKGKNNSRFFPFALLSVRMTIQLARGELLAVNG